MASAKSHTGSVLNGTKTTYFSSTTENTIGPSGWEFIPSVAMDLYITGGWMGATPEAIRVKANERYQFFDKNRDITLIEANMASGESAGTLIMRPLGIS